MHGPTSPTLITGDLNTGVYTGLGLLLLAEPLSDLPLAPKAVVLSSLRHLNAPFCCLLLQQGYQIDAASPSAGVHMVTPAPARLRQQQQLRGLPMVTGDWAEELGSLEQLIMFVSPSFWHDLR